jgi:hypothetical protein
MSDRASAPTPAQTTKLFLLEDLDDVRRTDGGDPTHACRGPERHRLRVR